MRCRFALGTILVAGLAMSASLDAPPAEARPRKVGASVEAFPFRITAVSQRPRGEVIAPSNASPICAGEEEGQPSQIRVKSQGRTIELRSLGGGDIEVREGKRLLWKKFVGSAGGADATTACSHDGWGVVIAGHYRHGDDVFDLFTGKKTGPGDVRAYAPDLSYALVPPSTGWARDCLQMLRTFRVPLDGSKRPYALDTPPAPDICADGEPKAGATTDAPSVGISADGALYAVASPVEIGLYRALDDEKVGRLKIGRAHV